MKLLNVITPVVSFLLTAGVTVGLSAQDAQPPNPQQEQTSDADAGQSTNDTPERRKLPQLPITRWEPIRVPKLEQLRALPV